MNISTNNHTLYFDNIETCVDEIINKVGKKLVVAAPFGIGKPNHLLNALYHRIKKDKFLKLKLITALNLNPPLWKNELEKRLLQPIRDRLWHDYPELEYINELDSLPNNFELVQFFFLNLEHVLIVLILNKIFCVLIILMQ